MPKLHWNLRAKPAWNLGMAILPVSRGLLLWLGGNSLTKMGSASLSYWTTPIWLCPFFGRFFFLFKRHRRESTSLKHTAASSGLSLWDHLRCSWTNWALQPRWGRETCWQRAPRSARPRAEDCPPSRPGLSADCHRTWRINFPSPPNPAF